MTILGLLCVLSSESKWSKHFFRKYGPETGRTAWRQDGHQYVLPNYLWPWDDHWYFFNSIHFKFYIEVNMYHIQLHNEDWHPKAYVPRKQCSHAMSTVAGPSFRGGTMKWTRSELWRQQCTSKGETFMGKYITDNPRMIVHIRWSPWQPEGRKVTLPPKWTFLSGNLSCNKFACNQSGLSIVACISMLIIINDHIETVLLFYFRSQTG